MLWPLWGAVPYFIEQMYLHKQGAPWPSYWDEDDARLAVRIWNTYEEMTRDEQGAAKEGG